MAAQKGVLVLIGRSGRRYSKQLYFDDTAAHQVNFDSGVGASATSENFFNISPEDMTIIDLILAAATGQTQTQVVRNNVGTGDYLLNSVQLASVATRTPLAIPLRTGDKLALIQVA